MSGAPGEFILNSKLQTNTDSNFFPDPSLLVISCEKIRASLMLLLGRRDRWRGQITLFINPSLPESQGPFLQGVYDEEEGWSYRLSLPSPIEPKLLLRAIVKALLTEVANRRAGGQSAEVPFWLVAGLSANLQADNLPTLLLRPQSQVFGDRIGDPRVDPLREALRREAPLSFQQLCWPEPERLAGQNYELYSACARLFVDALLRFKDGPRCLNGMMDELPQHLNWQTSFLHAFAPHFNQLLDVEKWWGLVCINFTGEDFAARFSPSDSWHQLQQALDVPVEVHFSPDHLPAQAEITLQEVIKTWQPAQVEAALQRAAANLSALRPRIAPELRPLLESYLSTVQDCLGGNRPGAAPMQARASYPQPAGVRNAACKTLDALDAQRAAMRSKFIPKPAPSQRAAPPRPPGRPSAASPGIPPP
jgi:hypothetical protein